MYTRLIQAIVEFVGVSVPLFGLQSDWCGLHIIKYDYLGHFETMEEDTSAISKHLGLGLGDAFAKGLTRFFTNASGEAAAEYTKVCCASECCSLAQHGKHRIRQFFCSHEFWHC